MGDSFTEGLGVVYESTFAGRLASSYAAEGIDVLNAGVLTYSGRVVDAPGLPFDLIGAWTRNSLTYRGVAKAAQILRPHAPLVGCTSVDAREFVCLGGWTLSRAAMDRYGRDGLRRADEQMTRLAALLRARGIPLMIVVYPWPQQSLWNDRSSLQVSYWRRWAERERVGFIERAC